MAPEEHSKSLETDEFIYPDQVLEAMGKGLKINDCFVNCPYIFYSKLSTQNRVLLTVLQTL